MAFTLAIAVAVLLSMLSGRGSGGAPIGVFDRRCVRTGGSCGGGL